MGYSGGSKRRDGGRYEAEVNVSADYVPEGTIQALVKPAFYPFGGVLVGNNYVGSFALDAD